MSKFVVVIIILWFYLVIDVEGQNTLDRLVSLDLKEVSLKRVLKEIESQAKVKFVYSRNHVDMTGTVTVKALNEPIGVVLNRILEPRNVKLLLDEDDYIILKRFVYVYISSDKALENSQTNID